MSVAEMKELIIKKVVATDDSSFLNEVLHFINEQRTGAQTQEPDVLDDIDAFYERLKAQYGDVLQKLAQ